MKLEGAASCKQGRWILKVKTLKVKAGYLNLVFCFCNKHFALTPCTVEADK